MLLNFQTFYHKFGCRTIQQLMTPKFFDLKFLELPLESIYHYLEYDGIHLGPSVKDEYLFRHTKRIIPIESIFNLKEHSGNPHRIGTSMVQLVKDYLKKNRQLKMMHGLEQAQRDKQAIVVYNYAPLGKEFKYQQSAFASYYRWRNIFATAIKTIGDISHQTNRQHFIKVASPKVVPGFQQLMHAAEKTDQASLKPFRDTNAYILLELWKWLTNHRAESLFSSIPNDRIHHVNLIFEESGQWCVLNLGLLNSFRENPELPAGDEVFVRFDVR